MGSGQKHRKYSEVDRDAAASDVADVTIVLPGKVLEQQLKTQSSAISGSDIQTSVLPVFNVKKLRNVDYEIETIERFRRAERPVEWDGEADGLDDVSDTYVVNELFAQGGQGKIYLAVDRGLKREVALKSLNGTAGGTIRKSFIAEARVTASLEHPSIVPIYKLCTDEKNGLHLAMKLLRGQSLKDYLEKICQRYSRDTIKVFDENASLMSRLEIFLRICDAMEYAHSRGVLHCDLKPENIMIGEYRDTYIMDWGIARKIDDPPRPRIMGTPRYTSPENVCGSRCDIRSDIYSLGIMLFELTTLNAAFSGATVGEVLERVKNGEINEIRHRFGGRIHRDLAAIIRKASALDPEDRYRNIAEFSEDLRSFMRGSEVSANPDGPVGRIVRWINGHRRLVALSVIALFFGGAALNTVGIYANIAYTAQMERQKDEMVIFSYAKMRKISENIQQQLTHISGLLSMLNSDVALLLDLDFDVPSLGTPEILSGEETEALCRKNGTGIYRYSARPFDMSRISSKVPAGCDMKQIKKELSRVRPIGHRMRSTVLESSTEFSGRDINAAIEAYKKNQLPVLFAYFALHSGLLVIYPGNNDFNENYDARKRIWFKLAAGNGAIPVWSEPYPEAGAGAENIPLVSCSMEIIGAGGHSHGVSAVDIPLTIFENILKQNPDAAVYTISRQLVSESGQVMLKVTGDDSGSGFKMQDAMKKQQFRSDALMRRFRRSRYGSFTVDESSTNILWMYSYIPELKWFYIEKVDFDKLMQLREWGRINIPKSERTEAR